MTTPLAPLRAFLAAERERLEGIAAGHWDVDEGDFTLYTGDDSGSRVVVDAEYGLRATDFLLEQDERHMRWIAHVRQSHPQALTYLERLLAVAEASVERRAALADLDDACSALNYGWANAACDRVAAAEQAVAEAVDALVAEEGGG